MEMSLFNSNQNKDMSLQWDMLKVLISSLYYEDKGEELIIQQFQGQSNNDLLFLENDPKVLWNKIYKLVNFSQVNFKIIFLILKHIKSTKKKEYILSCRLWFNNDIS